MNMPESIRWLERKSRINDAIREVGKYYGVRLDPGTLPTVNTEISKPILNPPSLRRWWVIPTVSFSTASPWTVPGCGSGSPPVARGSHPLPSPKAVLMVPLAKLIGFIPSKKLVQKTL
jgi:hypothetical protein